MRNPQIGYSTIVINDCPGTRFLTIDDLPTVLDNDLQKLGVSDRTNSKNSLAVWAEKKKILLAFLLLKVEAFTKANIPIDGILLSHVEALCLNVTTEETLDTIKDSVYDIVTEYKFQKLLKIEAEVIVLNYL